VKAALFAAALSLLAGAGWAQEPPAAGGPQGEHPAAVADQERPTADELEGRTLASDIASASYYELVAWCRSLGLDETGGRVELQQRLATALGVQLPGPGPAPRRTVTVRSARESQYFTISEVDQKYVTLTGDVVVEVRDTEGGAVHEIRASRILYNQSRGVVTADGGVSYTLTRAGRTESFEGASLSFDMESSEAVFYDGRSSKSSTRNGAEVTYFFTGRTISRLDNDTVVMEDGSFSSCDLPSDPHYQIRARKVWILAPGEWAIQGAVLFVGRVPVLYLPVFFWPGDRMLFNPALGYREREGTYVQTTTYLLGRKEKEQDNPLSFLKLEETGTDNYDLELHGLFLRRVTEKAARAPDSRTLKLLLDAYSRLGVFAGLVGDFPPLASFTAGIGASRSLFGNSTSNTTSTSWTQFWEGESWWNSSSFAGIPLPLRFGLEGTLKQSGTGYSLGGRFEYYSDPSFTSDFLNRTEGLALSDVLSSTTAAAASVAKKTTLAWDATASVDLARLLGLPSGVSLSVPTLNAKMSWLSRDAPYVFSQPEYWDPGKTFYYPSSVTFPSASVSFSGELLRLDLATGKVAGSKAATPAPGQEQAGAEAAQAEPTKPGGDAGAAPAPGPSPATGELRPPYPVEPGPAEAGRDDGFALRAPGRKADLPVSGAKGESTLTVSYQVQPRVNLEHTYDGRAWTTKEAVDYSILYRTFETGGTSSLSATAVLLDRLAEVSAGLSADGNYRLRFDPAAVTPADWDGLRLRDYQQDRFELRTSLAATLRPLESVPAMSGSSLSWRLGWRPYQLAFTGTVAAPVFTPSAFAWDQSSVPEHSLQSTVQLAAFGQTDTLSLSLQLPPLATVGTAALAFGVGEWKTRVQGGVRETAGVVQAQPLSVSSSVLLGGAVTASEDLQFLSDPASPGLDRSVTQLSGWGVTAAFTAERMLPVAWDGASYQWKTTGSDKQLLASTLRLAYAPPAAPRWWWNDRVRLESALSTSWNVNLQRYTDSTFDFSLKLGLVVSEFLELSFTSVSANSKTYRYIPGWPEAVGETWVNPLTDLLASYNFWNISDRYRSGFKIRSLGVKAVHHLHDWDLTFEYQGTPQLVTLSSGQRQYQWTPTFSILVQWIPVPEVKSRIRQDSTGLNLRS
jgi:hypothetical protein